MSLIPKRILVVAHDRPLRWSRVAMLKRAGYAVASVETDDEAMAVLQEEKFDLILLGRKFQIPKKGIDQRLREKYPYLLTLQIAPQGEIASIYPSRITDAMPEHVLKALKEMLQLKRRNDHDF
jgi:DNA-binding NtrC family response regulator